MAGASEWLGRSDIAALSTAIERGEVSPVELVELSLQQAEVTDARYRAFTTIARERALHFARAAQERARAGARLGTLDGIPLAVKDMVDVRGLPTTNGSGPTWRTTPQRSAPVVERLER